MDKPNTPLSVKEDEITVKSFPTRKTVAPDGFTGKFKPPWELGSDRK